MIDPVTLEVIRNTLPAIANEMAADLQRMPATVSSIVFTITSFGGQKFTDVARAFCRIVDASTRQELVRYDLSHAEPRSAVLMAMLRRTPDDTDSVERPVVANAEQLIVVASLADPPPRLGLIDRCLVAAYDGGLQPVLCLTKRDLADPEPFAAEYAELALPVVVTRNDEDPTSLRELVDGRVSAMVGHSGVGKSTLVNALVPDAERAVGEVSGVGKGRHTSTSAVALPLPDHRGWVIDTPGVRSFGLAHVTPDAVIAAFDDLAAAINDCPRGCGHLGPPADPECALDTLVQQGQLRAGRLNALRRVLVALR